MAELNAIETLLLELNNRARMNPLGEAARYGNLNLTSGGGTLAATASTTTITSAAKADFSVESPALRFFDVPFNLDVRQ